MIQVSFRQNPLSVCLPLLYLDPEGMVSCAHSSNKTEDHSHLSEGKVSQKLKMSGQRPAPSGCPCSSTQTCRAALLQGPPGPAWLCGGNVSQVSVRLVTHWSMPGDTSPNPEGEVWTQLLWTHNTSTGSTPLPFPQDTCSLIRLLPMKCHTQASPLMVPVQWLAGL